MRTLKFCCLLGITGTCLAVPPFPRISYYLDIADSCGPIQSEVPYSGVNRGHLLLRFQHFQISSHQQNPNQRTCHIRAQVVVPAGLKFKPTQILSDGEYATSEYGQAGFLVNHTWNGLQASRYLTFEAGQQGTFLASVTPENQRWQKTACQQTKQVVNLSAEFSLDAHHGESDQQFSDIALFNVEQSSNFKSRWLWDWSYCNPWLNFEYQSKYKTIHGEWIHGKTVLNGLNGFYTTHHGTSGKLHSIYYQNNYRQARGLWTFDDGQTGWFIFQLDEQNDQAFTGFWGKGTSIGHQPLGQWMGEVAS